jgi:hypothetical protein
VNSGRAKSVLRPREFLEIAMLQESPTIRYLVIVPITTLHGLSTDLSPKIKDSIPAVIQNVLGFSILRSEMPVLPLLDTNRQWHCS